MASQADQPTQAKNLLAVSSQNTGAPGGFDISKHVAPKLTNKGFNKETTLRDAAQANLLNKETKIPNWWGSADNPYNKRTNRAELFATRKAENKPHISFDLDGDGYVGNRDFVIAKIFDKDGDGRLNTQERANADSAMRNVRNYEF